MNGPEGINQFILMNIRLFLIFCYVRYSFLFKKKLPLLRYKLRLKTSPSFKQTSWWLASREPACNAGDPTPWVGKSLWRREWLPTPVFLPEKIPWTEEPSWL